MSVARRHRGGGGGGGTGKVKLGSAVGIWGNPLGIGGNPLGSPVGNTGGGAEASGVLVGGRVEPGGRAVVLVGTGTWVGVGGVSGVAVPVGSPVGTLVATVGGVVGVVGVVVNTGGGVDGPVELVEYT
jgi:hypothetical protein